MAYERRSFAGAAVSTTLGAGINAAAMSFTIASATGWPDGSSGDFFVVVDRGGAAEEKIRCASRSGTTVTVATSGRGADGTSAASHSSGESVEHSFSAVDANEANKAVAETVGKVTTKGDLLVGTAANALARVGVGANGVPLVGASGQTAGAQFSTLAEAAYAAGTIPRSAVKAEAWTSFTPTFVNLTIGNGTSQGIYERRGNTVDLQIHVTLGSTSSVGSSAGIDLPVTASTTITSQSGGASYFDNSLSTVEIGFCMVTAVAPAVLSLRTEGTGSGLLAAGNPFAWGTSDQIRAWIRYETA